MKSIINIILSLLLLFATINVVSAAQDLPFKRIINVNEWSMQFSTKANIDQVINDVSYMNGDAIAMYIGSEYFEAVRDPAKADWDKRASWNMLEYAITKAHEKNIQLHVTLSINSMLPVRAESRLFGTRYNVVDRYGTVDPVRIDHAFTPIQDYEADLIGFIAGHYPALNGINIEEPFYTTQSYSTAMRERVKAKYGYDPLTRPSDQTVPIINDVARDVFIESFTRIRASFNASKSNPNMLL